MENFHIGSIDGAIAIVLTTILSLAALFTSVYIYFWIYFSFIRKGNKEQVQGFEAAKKVFEADGNHNVKIESSLWTIKFWALSKKNNTFKLRPWTYKRKSIWTLTEASQQAYLENSSVNKRNKHFSTFTLPLIIKIASITIAAAAILVAILAPSVVPATDKSDFDGTHLVLPYLLVAAAIWVTGSSLGSLNKARNLRKDLVPMIKGIMSDSNARSVQRVLRIQWIFALSTLVVSIASLPALFVQIANVVDGILSVA